MFFFIILPNKSYKCLFLMESSTKMCSFAPSFLFMLFHVDSATLVGGSMPAELFAFAIL